MVLRNDYIMGMIERLAEAFASFVVGKTYEEGSDPRIDLEHLDLTLSTILDMRLELIDFHLSTQFELLADEVQIEAARMLMARADVASAAGYDDKAQLSATMAFQAFLRRPSHRFLNSDIPAADALMELLHSQHAHYFSPEEIQQALRAVSEHHWKRGRFARAEDLLFHALEYGHTPELHQYGIAFYDDLIHREDEDLAHGNFSREEVDEGRAQLLAQKGLRT